MDVRPEYAALADAFVGIAADFGHAIDARLRRDVARLASALEIVDRRADAVRDDAGRRALWADLLAAFRDGDPLATGDLDLARGIEDLRRLAVERGVHARMARVLAKEVRTSEAMREARDARAFVRCVVREGRLTAALALLVAGDACGRSFRRFFFRLGGPANVVDKLKDVRSDHARGEMRLAPGLALYARLVLALARATPALLRSHRRWDRVLVLGLRFAR